MNLTIIKNLTTDIVTDLMVTDTMDTDTMAMRMAMDTVFTILHITHGRHTIMALIIPMKTDYGEMNIHTVLIIPTITIQVSHSWLHFLNKLMAHHTMMLHTTMLHTTHHRIMIFHTMQHLTTNHLTMQLHFMS